MREKTFFPVAIDITGKRILIVGGGKVALHKLAALKLYTANIDILAPGICPEIAESGYELIRKKFEPGDLDGFGLVYACTNDRDVNRMIAESAAKRHILCNVADDPELSDFISPAVYKKDNMSVSVTSGGADVKKSIKWRNRIREIIENDSSEWD